MTTMRYDIPVLDRNTRFSLWQVKMRLIMAQFDLDDVLVQTEYKQRRDRKALSLIHLYLSNDILQDQKLYSHRVVEGESLKDHIVAFKEIVVDLEMLEVKYDEEDLALILLCSLPGSYATFWDTILYSQDTLTIDDVYDGLYSKEKLKH
ncbi:uncharacterized protein LOC111411510 [Olea europaea var. sylvestris]|uniref:uncharacterized protein LOC111411510 n=1 Tax=Olea europaea var. sylvestris TaxID=158386 RepID=UPI000C1D19EB|nr:uncharacterized protein LOC111411510 [Olea europaea var. sylvestris]